MVLRLDRSRLYAIWPIYLPLAYLCSCLDCSYCSWRVANGDAHSHGLNTFNMLIYRFGRPKTSNVRLYHA